ncbi:right-handed parallel beta-helix repeat-containing protein [Ferruginibacter profundus]
MKSNHLSTRRVMRSFAALFTLIFCFALTASATTYYISPSGNDATGTGTSANPWKTLYKATNTVAGVGDIIHVNAGTYIETLQCALKPGVSIEGDGATSILKSSLTADWTEMLSLRSAEGTNGNQHISFVKFDGQNLSTFWGIYVGGRSNVSIHDITMVDFKDRGILFGGRNDGNGAPPTIYATGNSFYNNTITNCAAYNLSTGAYGRGCLNIGGQDGMLIYNNTISQTSRPEGYNGWPIKGWNEGYLKGCKIYNNTLNKIPMGNSSGNTGWNFAIELFNESGLEIYGNTITGGSIDLNFQTKNGYAYSVWIHDNIIKQTTLNTWIESGIVLEYGTDGAIIENNTIDKKAHGIEFNPRSGDMVKDVTIRKNLLTNITMAQNTGGLIGVFSNAGDFSINNFNVLNNTMVATAGSAPWWGINFGALNAGTARNISIKNNIIMNILSGFMVQGGAIGMDSVYIQNNNTYNNGNSNNPTFNGVVPTNYTNSNNISVVPLFVSATDFHLQALSPCIDNGVYVGLPYTGAAPDKGFAEFGSIILPVKLLDFTAAEKAGKNILQWKTATESNSDYFSIERSSDGQHFTAIGRVSAAGFSSSELSYNFTDASPIAGVNYYRLVMLDKDASKDYSNTVAVMNKKDQSLSITKTQLSAGNKNLALTVASTQNQKVTLSLFDAGGRIFINETMQLQKGMNTINTNTPSIATGIYYIKLAVAGEMIVKNVLGN